MGLTLGMGGRMGGGRQREKTCDNCNSTNNKRKILSVLQSVWHCKVNLFFCNNIKTNSEKHSLNMFRNGSFENVLAYL